MYLALLICAFQTDDDRLTATYFFLPLQVAPFDAVVEGSKSSKSSSSSSRSSSSSSSRSSSSKSSKASARAFNAVDSESNGVNSEHTFKVKFLRNVH